ncbi:MAG TPA: Ldh family oxidoreductase [bacterium]|nr:Ldh family oxidoreductase [bacterium]HPG46505.1 Ldh family oxidoreductase [bacterium]HPM98438.1 Ldh family oxidoreductase [bacterium]
MPITIDHARLLDFVQAVFASYELDPGDAHLCADNLVAADMRGIPSHGVARLKRYTDGIADGLIFPMNRPLIVTQSVSSAAVDGQAGLGQIVAAFATRLAIEKAQQTGVGVVTVRNSNHYGIAGYYAQMMLDQGLLGVSMTNSAPLVVPTFGKEMVIGTNPISLAAPARRHRPFFLDMATSVVPRGKLEVYNRENKSLPTGWAVGTDGKECTDASVVLDNMTKRAGGGILPLGGEGELYSGYKGYGLAVLVDILSGVLSGGSYTDRVYAKKDGKNLPPDVGHFFMALKIEAFIPRDVFLDKMDDLIDSLTQSAKAEGQNRIYIHGEKEYERFERYKKEGIPLQEKVYATLKEIARDRGLAFE